MVEVKAGAVKGCKQRAAKEGHKEGTSSGVFASDEIRDREASAPVRKGRGGYHNGLTGAAGRRKGHQMLC